MEAGPMSGTFDRHMEEDRETLQEVEGIYLDLYGISNTDVTKERLGALHRRLRAQFEERYGERP
jgi:hypothetical protein